MYHSLWIKLGGNSGRVPLTSSTNSRSSDLLYRSPSVLGVFILIDFAQIWELNRIIYSYILGYVHHYFVLVEKLSISNVSKFEIDHIEIK